MSKLGQFNLNFRASLHIAVSSLFTGFNGCFLIFRAKYYTFFIYYIFYIFIFYNFILKKYALIALSLLFTEFFLL